MGRPSKYKTEEERMAARRASNRQSYLKHKDEEGFKAAKREYDAKRYQQKKDKILAYQADYYQQKKDKILAQKADYYQENRNEIVAQGAEYRSTQKGRANNLVRAYRQADKKYNRGECSIDAQWIIDNVFSGQCCHYCGESDWHLLGCDRIDNSLPHTPENCVPCCTECNTKRGTTPYEEYLELICNSQTD